MLTGKDLTPAIRCRNTVPFLLFFLAGLLCCLNVQAEIYRWTDAKGKVHFSDKPTAGHSSDTVQLRINTVEAPKYSSTSSDALKQVTIYSASWCGVCKKAKAYFREKNIPFKDFDIEKSRLAKSNFRRLGGKGVPLILVGNQRMSGFSESGFEQIYGGSL